MSDIKLCRITSAQIDELVGKTDTIEKSVQVPFEKNLDTLLWAFRMSMLFQRTRYDVGSKGRKQEVI